MEIKVRDIDPLFVKEFDKRAKEIAKKIDRKFSRNDYLLMVLQNDYELRLQELKQDKFDKTITNLKYSLDNQSKQLQEYIDSNNRLLLMLASGTVEDEGGIY